MIGEINRTNPYIIQLLENLEPSQMKAIESSRKFTESVVFQLLLSIFLGLLFFSIEGAVVILLYNIITIVCDYNVFSWGLKRSPLAEITRIIYGSQYEKIYVNNEKLLILIQDLASFNQYQVFLQSYFKWMKRKNFIVALFAMTIPIILYFI